MPSMTTNANMSCGAGRYRLVKEESFGEVAYRGVRICSPGHDELCRGDKSCDYDERFKEHGWEDGGGNEMMGVSKEGIVWTVALWTCWEIAIV
jgi:hypothetical protein